MELARRAVIYGVSFLLDIFDSLQGCELNILIFFDNNRSARLNHVIYYIERNFYINIIMNCDSNMTLPSLP